MNNVGTPSMKRLSLRQKPDRDTHPRPSRRGYLQTGWRRLAEKNEGLVASKCSFRFHNLLKRAPDVNGRCSRTFASSPGNRSTQGVVNLEGAGTITETLQPPAVTRQQLGTCKAKKLSGSDVSENEVTLRELRHFVIDFDTTAKTFQMEPGHLREFERHPAEWASHSRGRPP